MSHVALGPDAWAAAKPFYDQQTLVSNGEPLVEQYGARVHGMGQLFPNDERFWRYHVCPATGRPNNKYFLEDVHDITQLVGQRSFTVFAYALESLERLAPFPQVVAALKTSVQ